MLQYKRVHLWNISGLLKVLGILDRCGKDMAKKYALHHWDNSFVKNLAIVGMCALKNKIWLVLEDGRAVATFQTSKKDQRLSLQKLGTDPSHAGKGIGLFCMQTVEQMAKNANCKAVCLEVYAASTYAIGFYENRGYRCVGKVSTLKYSELKMQKNLE